MNLFYVAVSLVIFDINSAYEQLNILENKIIDYYAGRHSQILIGQDKMPFIVYASDKNGAIGIVHCEDQYCNDFKRIYIDTPSETPFHIANQIYMKVSPQTNYPQILYSLTTSLSNFTNTSQPYVLRFITCHNIDCSHYNKTDVSGYGNRLINNGNDFYVYFTYKTGNNGQLIPIVSYNQDPTGLFMIECGDSICLNGNSAPIAITKQSTNYNTGWYNAIYIIDTYYLFLYYNDNSYELQYTFYDYNSNKTISNMFVKNIHGAWLDVTQVTNMQIAVVYSDSVTGNYSYGLCDIQLNPTVDFICNITIIDTGLNATDPTHECNGYNMCTYPDVRFIKYFNDGNPITSYFDKTVIKLAQCDNLSCEGNTYIQTLSTGSYGYGRDSSIAWLEEQGLMYVSFLDYNGNGQDKKARLLIADVIP
eukprot:380443_1